MARPERKNADYFPFYAKDGRTLFLLENKYGCKGTGFFTNVMRFLTLEEDHHFCIADEIDKLYFFTKCHCDIDSGMDMLNIMAKCQKIDGTLWESSAVIASEALLLSLSDAYRRRSNQIITMAEITEKFSNPAVNSSKPTITAAIAGITPAPAGITVSPSTFTEEGATIKPKSVENSTIKPQIKENEAKKNEINLTEKFSNPAVNSSKPTITAAIAGITAVNSGKNPQSKLKETKRKETKLLQENPELQNSSGQSELVIAIPLIDKSEYAIYQSDVSEWADAFPIVDIVQTLKRIRLWNIDNPKRQKTGRGIRSHITAWLDKEQNKGGKLIRNHGDPVTDHNMDVAAKYLKKEGVI